MRVEQPGPDTFLELADTPDSYASQASKKVSVKADETGLDFSMVDLSAYLTIADAATTYLKLDASNDPVTRTLNLNPTADEPAYITKKYSSSGAGVQPDTISGIKAWWKADDVVGKSNGDKIAQWDDSYSTYDLTTAWAPALTNAPTYYASGPNGKPYINFPYDGSTVGLKNTSFSTTQPTTVFFVAKVSSATGWYGATGMFGSVSGPYTRSTNNWYSTLCWMISSDAYNSYTSFAAGASNVYFGQWIFGWIKFLNGTIQYRIKGGTKVSETGQGTAGFNGGIIVGSIGTTETLGGDIAEFIVYDAEVSDADLEEIEDYAATKYGIEKIADAQTSNLWQANDSGGNQLLGISPNGGLQFTATKNLQAFIEGKLYGDTYPRYAIFANGFNFSDGTENTLNPPTGITGTKTTQVLFGSNGLTIMPSTPYPSAGGAGCVTIRTPGDGFLFIDPGSAKITINDVVGGAIHAGSSTQRALVIKGASGQTADLQNWVNSSATVLARITANGGLVINETGADADSRFEGDTATNLLVIDAGLDAVQIGTTTAGAIADFRATSITLKQDITLPGGTDLILDTTTGTKIGTATTQLLGFYNATPVDQPAALSAGLTTITFTEPGTPDYAIANLVQNTGYGFVSADEGQTLLKVVANLQAKVAELEARLEELGLIASN
jgi:hypothetical protein